jgi:predicted aspartyl protease
MLRYSMLTALALLFVSSPAAVAAQTPATGSITAEETAETEDVRVRRDMSDRMTVPVLLSGRGPYHFLVDTGANRTTISRQVATQLNLPSSGQATLHSVVGASIASTAIVPTVHFTRKPVKSVETPLLESEHMGADGILGTDMLSSQRVVFDFAGQTMSVIPSQTRHFDEPGTIVIEGRRKNGRLIVTDASANGRHLTVVVDTGAEVTIGNEALRRALFKGSSKPNLRPIELMSVTGQKLVGEYMMVREFELGGVTLTDLAVVFAPAHTFGQLSLNDRPAILLGMNAMRSFKKVSIDFANRTMRVIVPESGSAGMQAGRLTPGLMGGRL